MTDTKMKQASVKAHFLDEETQKTLKAVKHNNVRAIVAFAICWSILLVVGVAGIYRQNQIATSNKKHLDCALKLLATRLPDGARSRYITNSTTSCDIKFLQ